MWNPPSGLVGSSDISWQSYHCYYHFNNPHNHPFHHHHHHHHHQSHLAFSIAKDDVWGELGEERKAGNLRRKISDSLSFHFFSLKIFIKDLGFFVFSPFSILHRFTIFQGKPQHPEVETEEVLQMQYPTLASVQIMIINFSSLWIGVYGPFGPWFLVGIPSGLLTSSSAHPQQIMMKMTHSRIVQSWLPVMIMLPVTSMQVT